MLRSAVLVLHSQTVASDTDVWWPFCILHPPSGRSAGVVQGKAAETKRFRTSISEVLDGNANQ